MITWDNLFPWDRQKYYSWLLESDTHTPTEFILDRFFEQIEIIEQKHTMPEIMRKEDKSKLHEELIYFILLETKMGPPEIRETLNRQFPPPLTRKQEFIELIKLNLNDIWKICLAFFIIGSTLVIVTGNKEMIGYVFTWSLILGALLIIKDLFNIFTGNY